MESVRPVGEEKPGGKDYFAKESNLKFRMKD